MNKIIILFINLLFVVFLIIYSACSNSNNNEVKPCNVACTMLFAMVTVDVIDVNGNNIVLDSVYTTRLTTGEVIHLQQPMINRTYVVLDDSYMDRLKQSRDSFIFYGFKNGNKVVKQTFVISADCCHVQRQSGNSEIVIY